MVDRQWLGDVALAVLLALPVVALELAIVQLERDDDDRRPRYRSCSSRSRSSGSDEQAGEPDAMPRISETSNSVSAALRRSNNISAPIAPTSDGRPPSAAVTHARLGVEHARAGRAASVAGSV